MEKRHEARYIRFEKSKMRRTSVIREPLFLRSFVACATRNEETMLDGHTCVRIYCVHAKGAPSMPRSPTLWYNVYDLIKSERENYEARRWERAPNCQEKIILCVFLLVLFCLTALRCCVKRLEDSSQSDLHFWLSFNFERCILWEFHL